MARPTLFEPIRRPVPGPIGIARGYAGEHLAKGVVGFLFAATGPIAIVLAIYQEAGIPQPVIASSIFAAMGLSGLITITLSILYRRPMVHGWSIPGSVLLGPALTHLSFAEVMGASLATGVLIVLLGVSGLFKRVMLAVPMPLVMAMVAGIFLRFGLDIVRGFTAPGLFWVAFAAVAAYAGAAAFPRVGRYVPPVFAALVAGAAAAVLSGNFALDDAPGFAIVEPVLVVPVFSAQAMFELVVPLAIAVLVLQNAQGITVLRGAGHEAPINTVTNVTGMASIVYALLGSVNSAMAGPVNAIMCADGEKDRQYLGAVTWGLLVFLFGLFAPVATAFALAFPLPFIYLLGGLAMLRVLESSFAAAFEGRFTLGALIVFLVTVADVRIANIGAPFWGLVFGVAVSILLEREDFRAHRAALAEVEEASARRATPGSPDPSDR